MSLYMALELDFKIAATPWQQPVGNTNICRMHVWNTCVLGTVPSQYFFIIILQMTKFYISARNDCVRQGGQ